MTDADLRAQLQSLSLQELAMLEWRARWLSVARPKQVVTFSDPRYNTIMLHPGRGWGKTRVGANWISWELCNNPGSFGHVVGATHSDVRYTIIEGESGILREVPECLIKDYNSSDLVIEFYNGAVLRGFSAEKPSRLRGPQCQFLWKDELAAWQRIRETHEQADFGHRLGKRSLQLITTTPQPKELIRELFADVSVLKIGGHWSENESNLSPTFKQKMLRLEGTRLGRQELSGELLDAEELGVIKRSQWKVWPHDKPLPAFEIIIMSLDTALTEENVDVKKNKADFSACTVWGGFRERPLLASGAVNYEAKPEPRILMLDAWQERLGFPDLVTRVKKEKEAPYGEDATSPYVRPLIGSARLQNQGRKPDIILIEDKNSGISLRQMLRRDGIPVTPYNPGRADKYLRLNLTAPLFVAGYVHAVASAVRAGEFRTWAEPVIAQFCSYSGEGSLEHEDLLDSGTQALLWLARNWLKLELPTHKRTGPRNSPDGANPYAS